MRPTAQILGILLALCISLRPLLGIVPQANAADFVMTFDSLTPDLFTEIPTYIEGDFRLFGFGSPATHFHARENSNNSTTGAMIFGTDGTPQMFGSVSGMPFDLLSMDFFSAASPPTFTASTGATLKLTSPIPSNITFGEGFRGITSVRIDIESPGILGVDNIRVNAVPEPSTLALLATAAAIFSATLYSRSRKEGVSNANG